MTIQEQLGKVAWEAYGIAWEWKACTTEEKAKWIKVAEAVIKQSEAIDIVIGQQDV